MKTIATIAAICAALSGLAHSQTFITQTLNFSGVPDFSAPLLFNKYNGNVADLLNVEVQYSLTIDGGRFIVDNDSNTAANVTVNFGAELDATSSDVNLLNSSFNPIINDVSSVNSQTFNLAANVGDGLNDYDPTGPDGGALNGTTQTSSGGDDVNSMFFSQYVGPGTYTITAKSSQIGSLSFNSGIETATTPVTANGTITVIYTVVPEPSTAILSGLAVLGLATRRRRA
ncbi:MAG: choice-of-anchor E domain-containing protein [Armatimonadetes bacterium]|nr:choice-of-anchor E domain-containing protein [Akkermansiaceae bacterium]